MPSIHDGKTVAKFIVPDWGAKDDVGIGLSYRPAKLHLPNQCHMCNNGQLGCGAAQSVVRRLAVRQARVRFPARHPSGDPSSEQQQ